MPAKAKAIAPVKREPTDLLPICGCEGCQPLEAEFKDDPVMLSFLKRTLLKRGWTGTATAVEKSYQRAHSTWAAGAAERGAALASEHGLPARFPVDQDTSTPRDDSDGADVPEQAILL